MNESLTGTGIFPCLGLNLSDAFDYYYDTCATVGQPTDEASDYFIVKSLLMKSFESQARPKDATSAAVAAKPNPVYLQNFLEQN